MSYVDCTVRRPCTTVSKVRTARTREMPPAMEEITTPGKMRRLPEEDSFSSSQGRTNAISFSAPTYSELRRMQKGSSESFTSGGSPSNSFSNSFSRRRNSIAQMQSVFGLDKQLFTGAATFYEKLVSDPVPFGTLPWVLEQRKREKEKGKQKAARSLDVDDDTELNEIEKLLSSGPPSRRAGAASNRNSPLNSPTEVTSGVGVAAES